MSLQADRSSESMGKTHAYSLEEGRLSMGNISKESSADFPVFSHLFPTSKDFFRMMAFVTAYLLFVFVLCLSFWVVRSPGDSLAKFVIVSTSITEAIVRVVIVSWLLKIASARMALVFVEIDLITVSTMALLNFALPRPVIGSLQFQIAFSPMDMDGIFKMILGASIKELLKVICYLIPLVLGQTRSAFELLFTSAVAGSLSMLYSDILVDFDVSGAWQKVVMGVLYTFLFPLWTSLGCSILCHIKRNSLKLIWAPMVLVVPVSFHSLYLLSTAPFPFGWAWAGIVVGFWVVSALILAASLSKLRLVPQLIGV